MIQMTCNNCWSNIDDGQPHLLFAITHPGGSKTIKVQKAKEIHICEKCANEKKWWSFENPTWDADKESAERARQEFRRKEADEIEKRGAIPADAFKPKE